MDAPVVNDIRISSTDFTPQTGSVTISDGIPYETIDLKFVYDDGTSEPVGDESIEFSGVNQGVIDHLHTVRYGSVQLRSDGRQVINYSATGANFVCMVQIIARSSGNPIPFTGTSTLAVVTTPL